MSRKFLFSVVVVFVLSMLLGFVIHGVFLAPDYAQLPNLFRPEQDAKAYFPWMLAAHVFLAAGFVWIYLKGRERGPFLMQGVRYGIAVAVLVVIPMYLIYYAVQPMPGDLVVKQIVSDSIGYVALGIVVAWLNR